MKTIEQLIASARRELNLRERKYPEWIRRGQLSRDRANHELECMFEIIRTLEDVQRRGGPQMDLFAPPADAPAPDAHQTHNPPP